MQNFQKVIGLSQQDFHVSLIVSQVLKKRPATSAIFGLSVAECYATYDRHLHYLKTLEGFLPLLEENIKANFSMGFCRTFTNAGMMRNGKLYRLKTSERPISGKESGLWPTPKTNCFKKPCIHGNGSFDLQTAITLWPTPKACDFIVYISEKRIYPTPTSSMTTIQDMVLSFFSYNDPQRPKYRELFPTPTLPRPHDSNNTAGKNFPGHKQKDLTNVIASDGGQLNPDWVEAMMGYPHGWTDINKDDVSMSNSFPSAWLDGTWENDIPRTASSTKITANRLKCLGNSILPQISFFLWKMISVFKNKSFFTE